MPKATLEFDLPEEQPEYTTVCNARKYAAFINEYDQWLRGRAKYHDDEEAQRFRDAFWEMAGENGFSIGDIE